MKKSKDSVSTNKKIEKKKQNVIIPFKGSRNKKTHTHKSRKKTKDEISKVNRSFEAKILNAWHVIKTIEITRKRVLFLKNEQKIT